jgi:hypothetical protein
VIFVRIAPGLPQILEILSGFADLALKKCLLG